MNKELCKAIEENNTVEQLFDKAYALGREHEKQENPLAKRNHEVAEYLWQELLGVVMINEQGGLLSSEQTTALRKVLKDYKPIV